jgi:hypothetical protein
VPKTIVQRRKGREWVTVWPEIVSFYVTTDLSGPIIGNSNRRMACAHSSHQDHCYEQAISNFMLPALHTIRPAPLPRAFF